MPFSEMARESTVVASKCANVVAGAGSVEIVGGHVDGLHAGDASPSLVDVMRSWSAPISVDERRLVTDGARHTTEKRGHFAAGLREAEDVVDEQEHVLAFFVAEVLGAGQRGERDARAGAGRLVHLAEDQGRLAEHGLAGLELRLLHFEVEIVAFAGALTDAREAAHAAVRLGDVVDELHDEHGLADAGAAEEADFAALAVRGEQVDDLDAGLEDFDVRALIDEERRARDESASASWR